MIFFIVLLGLMHLPAYGFFNGIKAEFAVESDKERAENLLSSLLVEYPDNPSIIYNFGQLKFEQQDYHKAEAYFHSAALNNNAEKQLKMQAWFQRGNAFVALKQWQDALDNFKEVLVLDQNHKPAQEMIEKLEKLLQQQQEEQKNKSQGQQENNNQDDSGEHDSDDEDANNKNDKNDQNNDKQSESDQSHDPSSNNEKPSSDQSQKQQGQQSPNQEQSDQGDGANNSNETGDNHDNTKQHDHNMHNEQDNNNRNNDESTQNTQGEQQQAAQQQSASGAGDVMQQHAEGGAEQKDEAAQPLPTHQEQLLQLLEERDGVVAKRVLRQQMRTVGETHGYKNW